jgi:hypothetical protein
MAGVLPLVVQWMAGTNEVGIQPEVDNDFNARGTRGDLLGWVPCRRGSLEVSLMATCVVRTSLLASLSALSPVLSTASTCLASTRGICGDDGHFTVVNLQLFRRTFFAGCK